ncbi:hypothetical protein BC829DRAFT_208309 [Chytridium lagenaria]|nr:hypothetical protein BC829DRAFT_208309 [Chytridium lagenaria]
MKSKKLILRNMSILENIDTDILSESVTKLSEVSMIHHRASLWKRIVRRATSASSIRIRVCFFSEFKLNNCRERITSLESSIEDLRRQHDVSEMEHDQKSVRCRSEHNALQESTCEA